MKTKFLRILSSFLLVFAFGFSLQAQSISGTVTDENGVPLPGATVLVEGTQNGVSTDFDGNYSINASSGDTLVFSFVGYTTSMVAVGSSSTVNAQLSADTQLDEVVVTSLGIKRNVKSLGYSLTQLDGETISANPSSNAINALQGKVAGVMVTGGSMGSKGSSRVVIRGASSLSGNNQPLYVVDGITLNNNNLGSAGMWGGTDFGDGISSINPDDIESISVLKGGAAAALYGSRASNGVIIITTKNGSETEGLGIEFNSTSQFDTLNDALWDPQTLYGSGSLGIAPTSQASATDYLYTSWGSKMAGQDVIQFDGVNRAYSYKGDNQSKYFRTGTTYTNSISVSTGGENGNTRFSFTNLDNDDISPFSSLDRKSMSVNTSQKLGDKISIDGNIKYVLEDQAGNPNVSDGPGNANWIVKQYSPSVDVLWGLGPNGNGTRDLSEGPGEYVFSSGVYLTNPYFAQEMFIKELEKERFIGAINAKWDVTDYIYLRGRVGVDRYDAHRKTTTPYGTRYNILGIIQEQSVQTKSLDADLFIGTDNLSITNDLNLNAFVGISSYKYESKSVTVTGNEFIVPSLVAFSNTKIKNSSYGFAEKQINSAYGSAEFGFKDYVYLTLTARNDWFSTLSLKDKKAPNNDLYTSASLAFVLTDLIDLGETIDFLKFRAGYSTVAGGADDPYKLSLSYAIAGNPHLGNPMGYINGNQIPNSEITPFNKNETEFGVDIRLFDNKLTLDATYYDNETTGDIVGVAASATSGYSSALANLGKVTNKGVELLLKVKPIVTDDFSMELSFNYTNNNSNVAATNDTDGNISLQEYRGTEGNRNLRVTHIVGERYGALYGTYFDRDAAGNIKHTAMPNGGVKPIVITSRKVLGFGVAPTQLGIGASFRYKDFNAGLLVEGKYGGQIMSGTNAEMLGRGLHKKTVPKGGREAGLVPTGVMDDGSIMPSLDSSQQQTYWSYYNDAAESGIYDADYMRLRSLSIGYNVPSKTLDGSFIQKATISLIGKNLFFLANSVDNIDPESAYNSSNSAGLEYWGMPVPRTIGLNLNLKF